MKYKGCLEREYFFNFVCNCVSGVPDTVVLNSVVFLTSVFGIFNLNATVFFLFHHFQIPMGACSVVFNTDCSPLSPWSYLRLTFGQPLTSPDLIRKATTMQRWKVLPKHIRNFRKFNSTDVISYVPTIIRHYITVNYIPKEQYL